MNFSLFIAAFLGVFALLNMYIYKRFISKLSIKESLRVYLKIFLLVNFLGIIGYMSARYYSSTPGWLYFLLSLPIGLLFLLFCTSVIYDMSNILLQRTVLSQKRRDFLKRSLDVGSVAVATIVSTKSIYNTRFVELQRVKIKIKDLKRSYKIAQLSDTHIGGIIDAEFIKNAVSKVNELKPDIVVITGDLIDVKISTASEALNELKNLKSRYGTYFIVGNHEYFHGIDEIIQTVKSLGIRVLENENVYIGKDGQGFNLAGVYDVIGYRAGHHLPDIDKALLGKKESPTVLLAHQPRYIEHIQGGVDLVLSGHTHGGQIYPFKFLVKLQQPYISGLHRHSEDLQIYVNRGTGFWGPPMRLGASAEITEIVLQG